MPDDWTCDGCTFINSGYLSSCELCGAANPKVVPEEPITLSDDEYQGPAPLPRATTAAAAAGRGHDIINLADDVDEQQRGSNMASRAARPAARRIDTDVTIIDDDVDDYQVAGPASRLGSAAGPVDAVEQARQAAARGTSAGDTFSLDGCSCTLPLQSLANQLQPALTAAAKVTDSTTNGQAGTAVIAGAKGGGPSPLLQGPTLLDLAAPLVCPSAKCHRCLSSRDVRLLLGPYGTHVLYGAICTTLRHEAKAAKAAQREHDGGGSGGSGGAGASSAPAAAAGHQKPQSPRGRRRYRGAAAAEKSTTGGGGGGGGNCGGGGAGMHVPLLPLAPSCAACHSRMLPVSFLKDLQQQQQQQQQQPTTQRAAATTAPLLHPEELRGALAARTAAPPPPPPAGRPPAAYGRTASGAASLAPLASQLLGLLGPRCGFVCLRCPGVLEEEGPVGGPPEGVQALQAEAEQAARVLRLLRRVRALLLSAQEEEEEEEEAGGGAQGGKGETGQAGGSGGGRGGGRGGSGKRRRSAGRGGGGGGSLAWAKGVGYGGTAGTYDGGGVAAAKAVKEAQERQRKADEEVCSCLLELQEVISNNGSPVSHAASAGNSRGSGGALSSPPPVLLAALQYGGLPYVLRLLLQCDSLLDMGQRQGLYSVVLSIVRRITGNMSLLELLVLPATDPRDTAAAAAAADPNGGGAAGLSAAAAGGGVEGSFCSDPSLGAVFESLRRQCSVFKRAAQDLADGAEEDIAALGLALELGAVAEEVAAGVALWRTSMGGQQGILHALLRLPSHSNTASAAAAVPAAAPGGGLDAGGANDDAGPASKRPRRGAAAATAAATATAAGPSGTGGCGGGTAAVGGGASAAAEGAALAARRGEYVGVMRPLQFREVALLGDHHFRSEVASPGAVAGGEVMRQRLKRVTGEISGLASGLPLEWDAAAFVAVDEHRVDVLRALLIPSSDTPYANGAFVFDILLPPAYPNVPPKVQFLTTGGGRVRFNPNLYAEGKVCLSLLGTWSGPSWDPAMSTILQVLVSIHSMILVADPYYNEPGFEGTAATPQGRQAARAYSNTQRYNTLAFSILPALQCVVAAAGGGRGGKANALAGGSTFLDVLRRHFTLKRPELQRQCEEWQAGIAAAAAEQAAERAAGGGGGARAKQPLQQPQQQPTSEAQLVTYMATVVPQIKNLLTQL